MTESPIKTAAMRPGRGLRLALTLSVALNLAVVGVIGGVMLRADRPGGLSNMRDPGFGLFSAALTPEDRADLRRRYVNLRPELRAERRVLREDTEVLLIALRADPFDAAALDRAMQTAVDRLQIRLSDGQTLLRDFLIDLTPEARRAFADRLESATSFRRPSRTGAGAENSPP